MINNQNKYLLRLKLRNVYNIMEASGNVYALENLKQIVESKDIEIRNTKEKIEEQKTIIHDIENENHCFKTTIRKRNLMIKQLREKKKYQNVWDCIHDNFDYHRLDSASHQAITHHALKIQDILAE